MTLKIVSLNIWLGGYLQDSAISYLKAQNADIVMLQEVYDGQEDALEPRYRTVSVLKDALGFTYASFAPDSTQKDKNVPIGNAIFSRFPITFSAAKDSTNGTNHAYNLQHAVVHTPDSQVNMFNIHGVWDLNGDNFSPERQAMAHHILDVIKGKENVILAGDINARPTNKAVIAIGEQLNSVFGNELTTTFNMRHKEDEGYASSVVDMIFVSPDMCVVEKSCLDVDISDHLPLTAKIVIN